MNNGVSRIESKNYLDQRTGVTFEEKERWLELWSDVRKKVVSNEEAYKVLSTMGIKERDYRTIKAHIENLLPLVNMGRLSELTELIEYCESRMPMQEFLQIVRERLPIEEMAPILGNLADTLIKQAPSPGQILRAFGSILAGGFPFDARSNNH
ncbi:hypothetical protein ES703_81099 [subsurface metagenome]